MNTGEDAMTEQRFEYEQTENILNSVQEGMTVYDSSGSKVGTVEHIQFGEDDSYGRGAAHPAPQNASDDALVNNLATIFGADQLPDTVRVRLLQQGFIRVDATGLFAADRYILPEQIAEVSDDRVILHVMRDDLLKH